MATAEPRKRESGFRTNPDYRITFERSPRRVRVSFAGETIADSTNAHLLFETRHLPVYYFPREDVRMDLLAPTAHASTCPYKGDCSYWTVKVGERVAENAVWSYLDPFEEVAPIKGYLAFYWNKMEHWYEEDEEVFVHPRDPYKRVDVLESSRHVQVILGGVPVADSRRARFLFETRLPTRYYLPRADVREDLLKPSAKVTRCPYKGEARYYSVKIGDQLFEDIVWYYPDPILECPKIRDLLCFYNEHVDEIRVDGVPEPRPVTPWSKDYDYRSRAAPDTRGPVQRP
jgi:uncharacterized protein (DUF427 family)